LCCTTLKITTAITASDNTRMWDLLFSGFIDEPDFRTRFEEIQERCLFSMPTTASDGRGWTFSVNLSRRVLQSPGAIAWIGENGGQRGVCAHHVTSILTSPTHERSCVKTARYQHFAAARTLGEKPTLTCRAKSLWSRRYFSQT
jgi:hypothetical protein